MNDFGRKHYLAHKEVGIIAAAKKVVLISSSNKGDDFQSLLQVVIEGTPMNLIHFSLIMKKIGCGWVGVVVV